jgi:hypothetical protein
MGYEDAFFRLKNVVGYSGNLVMGAGSLYFESPVECKQGRITIGHGDATNNGRGNVESYQNYVRQNRYHDPTDDGSVGTWDDWLSDVPTQAHTDHLHTEASNGVTLHVSRSMFIRYPQAIPSATRATIFYIIDNNPNKRANGLY